MGSKTKGGGMGASRGRATGRLLVARAREHEVEKVLVAARRRTMVLTLSLCEAQSIAIQRCAHVCVRNATRARLGRTQRFFFCDSDCDSTIERFGCKHSIQGPWYYAIFRLNPARVTSRVESQNSDLIRDVVLTDPDQTWSFTV